LRAGRSGVGARQNSGTSTGIGLMWTWLRSDSLTHGPDD
jgi:outer membrane protein